MTTIAEAILQGANKLRKAGVAEARREAGSLLGLFIERDRTFIISHAEDAITSEELKHLPVWWMSARRGNHCSTSRASRNFLDSILRSTRMC